MSTIEAINDLKAIKEEIAEWSKDLNMPPKNVGEALQKLDRIRNRIDMLDMLLDGIIEHLEQVEGPQIPTGWTFQQYAVVDADFAEIRSFDDLVQAIEFCDDSDGDAVVVYATNDTGQAYCTLADGQWTPWTRLSDGQPLGR